MHPHLRPLDTGEILDSAFRLYRRHFRAFLVAGLLPLSPLLLFWGWIAFAVWRGMPLDSDEALGLGLLATCAGWIPAVLTRGVAIRLTDDALGSKEVRPLGAFPEALRRLPALPWASGTTNLLITLPFLAGAGAMTIAVDAPGRTAVLAVSYALFALVSVGLAIAWFATLPAVMLEGASANAGRGRSWRLSHAARGKAAAVWIVGGLLEVLPWLGVEALLAALGGNTGAGLAFAVASLLSYAVAAFSLPLITLSRTLLFNDLRVRVEALDLRLLTERLAPARA